MFISDGHESMSMIWYFYIVTFEDYLPVFYFLIGVFPYMLIYPTVVNIKGLRDTVVYELASKQAEINRSSSKPNKNIAKGKEELEDEVFFELTPVYNEYMMLSFTVVFIYFAITKPYLSLYDYIVVAPFIIRYFEYFSYSQGAMLIVFGL